jgi:hypothetical protein
MGVIVTMQWRRLQVKLRDADGERRRLGNANTRVETPKNMFVFVVVVYV